MRGSAPNGYFASGMMVYGPLEKGGVASKGFLVQPVDRRGASIGQLNGYQDRIRNLLALLGPDLWAQFQWSCDGDYRPELTAAYREILGIADAGIRRMGLRYWRRHWKRLQKRSLRGEQLVLFVTARITAQSGALLSRDAQRGYYERLLA